MKKRPSPAPTPAPFSIAGQFTSPPFSVALESAELRRRLLEARLQPVGGKPGKPPGQHRAKKPKK